MTINSKISCGNRDGNGRVGQAELVDSCLEHVVGGAWLCIGAKWSPRGSVTRFSAKNLKTVVSTGELFISTINTNLPHSGIFSQVRTEGGESRKSRSPFAATDSKTSTSCRASHREGDGPSSKNANLKGLISLIMRNVLNNLTSQRK